MDNLWGRWKLVDPGRDSELKSSHGEDPGVTEISQEQETRPKREGKDLANTNKCTKAKNTHTMYPGSGPSGGGNTPTPAFPLNISVEQGLQLALRAFEVKNTKNLMNSREDEVNALGVNKTRVLAPKLVSPSQEQLWRLL